MAPRVLSLVFSFGSFGLFPGKSIWEATDPLTQLPQCLLRSGIITRQGSAIICSTVHAQGYLVYLELVCFSCL